MICLRCGKYIEGDAELDRELGLCRCRDRDQAKQGATYRLGKHRAYRCPCGAIPRRPLSAEDTLARPFPVPCEACGRSLEGRPFVVEDTKTLIGRIEAGEL